MNDTDATVVLSKPEARRRWRLYIGLAIGLVIAGPIISWAVMQGVRRHRAQQVLDEALAAVDRSDPGWRLADLEAARKPVADDENSALVVLEVKRLLPNPLEPGVLPPLPQCQVTPDEFQELQSQLQPLTQALAKASTLSNLADGRFPDSESKDPLAESKDCGNVAIVAQLLRMRATASAQSGDADGAVQATLGIAGAARAIGDERRLVAQLKRLQCRNELLFCVERVLGQGQPSEAGLAKLQQALEEEAAVPACLFAIEGERAGYHQLALAAEGGEIDVDKICLLYTPPANPWNEMVFGTLTTTLAREGHARMLYLMSELVEVAKAPPHLQHAEGAKLANSWDIRVGNYRFFPELDKRDFGVPGLFRGNLAAMRCGIVAIAAERYRQANHRWPEKVEDLAKGQLAPWAVDPLSGSPIRLELREDGLTVIAHGEEGVRREPTRTMRLYDPKHRRQPPQAVEEREPGGRR